MLDRKELLSNFNILLKDNLALVEENKGLRNLIKAMAKNIDKKK